jgi:hypothetical protein
MAKLSTELKTDIELLKKALGVIPVEEAYDPDNFGNAMLTMIGADIAVRLVRDRGSVFLDVAGSDGEWIDGNKIVETAKLHPHAGQSLPIPKLIALVCSNVDQIRKFLLK